MKMESQKMMTKKMTKKPKMSLVIKKISLHTRRLRRFSPVALLSSKAMINLLPNVLWSSARKKSTEPTTTLKT